MPRFPLFGRGISGFLTGFVQDENEDEEMYQDFELAGFYSHCSAHKMFCLGSVHTTPEEFGNESFTLKTHQLFSVDTTPEKFETQQSPVILDSSKISRLL